MRIAAEATHSQAAVEDLHFALQVAVMLAHNAVAGLEVAPLPLPDPGSLSAMPRPATRFSLEFQHCLERVRWQVCAFPIEPGPTERVASPDRTATRFTLRMRVASIADSTAHHRRADQSSAEAPLQ